MKVLITGVAGFIGFHLAKSLLENNFTVIGIDNLNSYYDINLKKERKRILQEKSKLLNVPFHFYEKSIENKEDLEYIFKKHHPKKVVNLAAQAGVRYSISNPEVYVQSNLVGFGNILECCKNFQIVNLLYASSSSVYGGNKNLPFSENQSVNHPVSLYAATKKANELMAHTYSSLYNLPATGLRFFTVYGPWGRPDMALFLFTKSIIEGRPIKIFNKGNMTRDFTFIDDIIKSMMLLLEKPAAKDINFDYLNPNPSTSWAPHRIFNIGNSSPTRLMDYIKEIERCLKKEAIKEFIEMQPGDVKDTASNTDALNKWIGFKPSTTISEGVSKFVDWYLDFY
tara:strand:- start:644 stop:1660 length:1017 start_codon:yes stop_codon:yes gene_type:complete